MADEWRTETNAADYFLHQKKRDEIEQRRPTIRKAADLVGPGIGVSAVRLTDYNDLLATFNGYYSSEAGAANAPNSTDDFVGQVVSDAALGGRQIFTSLSSGTEFVRTFTRSPTDPETIGWGAWSGQRIPPTAQGGEITTAVPSGSATLLRAPTLDVIGDVGVYQATTPGILLRRQGVYTGSIQVGASSNTPTEITIQRPKGLVTVTLVHASQLLAPTLYYPFTVWASDENQGFSVQALQSSGGSVNYWWRFQCTRIGDAV